jgi:hypothetical protein
MCRLLQVTWPDGSQDHCHVRPLAYVADLQEQCAVLSLKSTGTNLPDVQHMMPKEQLADFSTPLDSYSVRTEQLHKQAADQYKSQDPIVHAAGQALLDQLSMKPVPFVALWGFFINVYEAFPPDILHQDYLGITQHILGYISKVLRCAGKGLGGSLLQLATGIDRCVTEGERRVMGLLGRWGFADKALALLCGIHVHRWCPVCSVKWQA